jgi:hypothetical protein
MRSVTVTTPEPRPDMADSTVRDLPAHPELARPSGGRATQRRLFPEAGSSHSNTRNFEALGHLGTEAEVGGITATMEIALSSRRSLTSIVTSLAVLAAACAGTSVDKIVASDRGERIP